jgi:putative Ca2+/H+ antiporter (TMEM165/GDT1 family)
MKTRVMVGFAWALTALVTVLAFVAWADGGVAFDNYYLLFALFGLLAFSFMWTHYIVGAIRRLAGVEKKPLNTYFAVTGWAAVAFILLHPSLLILQLWRQGEGLPPSSYLNYVGPSLKWAVALGTFSFLLFMAFETKRWFNKKGWWPIIEYGNVVAMFAIIAHSLALGNDLQSGWFRVVWLWYATSLFVSVGYIYYLEAKEAKKEGEFMKKVIGIALVLAVIVGGGVFAYIQMNKDEQPVVVDQSTEDQALEVETSDQEVFTASEVADHNSKQDCWTIISGSIYDITEYIPRHPGGDEILAACGTDGTTLFTQRTDASGNEVGSGTPHSSSATSQLERYKVGTVSQ